MLCKLMIAIATTLAGASMSPAATYTWSGQLKPTGGIDIWSVRAAGLPYDLSVVADFDTMDRQPSVPFAAFEVASATLTLDGEPLPLVSDGLIDFTDSSIHPYDSIVFSGVFERNGAQTGITSSIAIDSGLLSFTNDFEQPPLFGATMSGVRSSTQGDFYISIVEAGTLVNSIPEPSAAFSAIGLMLLLRCQFSRRR